MYKTLCLLTASVALSQATNRNFEPTINLKELAQISEESATNAAMALLDQLEESADNANNSAQNELKAAQNLAQTTTVVDRAVEEGQEEMDEILKMLDLNGNGKVSWTEMITAINSLANMLNFKISATGKGELKYMWTLTDTDMDGEITDTEVKAILKKAPIIDKLNTWAAKVLKVGQ